MRWIIRFRPGMGFMLCFLAVCAAAAVGAYVLGETFIKIISEGKPPESTRVITVDSRPVAASEEKSNLLLDPVPLYYLQVGVYTDRGGAEEAVKPLHELGYNPYITRNAPYRIWVGVFRERKDTEQLKVALKEQGYGSFTGAVVINGENLLYGQERERLIKEIGPALEAYTAWLKESVAVLPSESPEALDFDSDSTRLSVLEEVYRKTQLLEFEGSSGSDLMNNRFRDVHQSIGNFHNQLNIFLETKDPEGVVLLQYKLLEFMDNYLLLWQEINNISKT
ncbi:SPOR domain-containing protein [Phosphitispora fastidiosa]|uniref:SPOR domain-containing protein n=1 Tax=Phosphitispora fastidiosa TaxID=2837202 RepID=UPI001E3E39FC|nr:SPOR domain-containing protein [Phosphitispora fastidiosa]MBU7008732.1 hypothetical protein [Phosphitispora fastidiosa]